ncbi:MAG TPA: hypothetical protein VFV92_01790 [Candidatus Bathyarchaeia archaeon]|nr:hypothetical protein [Candidatus Bathyarchaeia archaeon]
MAGRFGKRRRVILLAAIVVALSVGIVLASVPNVPKPHGSLQQTETHDIRGAGPNFPGAYGITLSNIPNSNSFSVAVAVTPGNATFCVTQLNTWLSWQLTNSSNNGYPFPSLDQNCILHEAASQATLSFTPPTSGDWVIVALNMNAFAIEVVFSPA